MSRILGLDLGPNSIGWTIIDDDREEIVGAGVRVFQEGVAKINQGDREEPWNKQRRDARGVRRNNARYRRRRNRLKAALVAHGLMPDTRDAQNEFFKIDPYEARLKGLGEKLSLHELGRALYHLNQRRGFRSNRKTDTSEDTKIFKGTEGKTGITATEGAIAASGSRTLGEYLAGIDPHNERRRNRYTLRRMYSEELDRLWEVQAKYRPAELTDDLKERIKETIIFYQRPLKSQKHTIGYCTLEPSKHRSPISSPTFQRYRILEQVNRLTVTDGTRYSEPLTPDERETLIAYLEGKKDAAFDQIIKALKLSQEAHFNLEDQKKLKGNVTYYHLSRVFGKRWKDLPENERHKIWHTLHFADKPEWLEKYAREQWGLDDNAVKKLLKVSLEPGYARLSHNVMSKMIPYLERGLVYSEAAEKAGYHHSQIERYPTGLSHLPKPDDLRNPLVQQAMYELRRVVNAIMDAYGKPDIIRVELARDLKLPKKLRQQITKDIRAAAEKADEIRERLKNELKITSPSREDVQRYLLWEELGTDGVHTCPYTGKVISLSAAYSGDFEIEHIFPYSRSLDDSMANKTLCWKPENQRKGERTPYEAYHHDEEKYQGILARVKNTMRRKLRKFRQREFDDDFVKKQLVDAAYFSKEAKAYLGSICDRVEAVSGRTTAKLRYFWGLNRILSGSIQIKNRDDHRHHAVDALVVANTTPGFVHSLSLYHEYRRDPKQEKFPVPWEGFREEAGAAVNSILVSHRIKARPRGKLHDETYYGQITLPNGEKTFTVRKPLSSLTAQMIRNIVDGGVRRAVEDRLAEFGVTDIITKFTIPKGVFTEPLYLPGVKCPIKSVRVAVTSNTMRQLYHDRNLWVEPGSNHHVVIFRNDEGKQVGNVVPLLDVVTRKRQGLPLIDKTPPDGYHFLMSLVRNDIILVDVEEDDIEWPRPDLAEAVSGQLYRVQKFDANGIIIFRHHTVAVLVDDTRNEPGVLRKRIATLAGLKAEIDPIGMITPAHD